MLLVRKDAAANTYGVMRTEEESYVYSRRVSEIDEVGRAACNSVIVPRAVTCENG